MHELIGQGDVLRISVPRNHFELSPVASHSLLVAGGIGVTPILSMAEHLHAEGADFSMHYCAKSTSHAAFHDYLASSSFSDRVRLHLDDGPQEQRFDARRALTQARRQAHVYVCGPKGFIDHVLSIGRAVGHSIDRLHSELFAAAPAQAASDRAFEIVLARSGRTVCVASQQTVVQALAEAGVDVPVSCEQGICGTCLTQVLDGEPEHRDFFLTAEERARNDCFLPCCSRATSARLVLEL